MKPLHIAVAGAVLLVAALVLFLSSSRSDRADSRRARGHDERGARAGGDAAEEAADAGAGQAAAGAGALSITVKIVGVDGSPAGGAEAEIDGGLDVLRAVADREGVLALRGLAPGIYDLRARRGKEAGALRFELRRTTDLGTLALQSTVSLRGRVHGPRGESLPGARVEACRASADPGMDFTNALRSMLDPEEIVARARTAGDGTYELALPEGGTYSLRASADGFASEGESARRYAVDTDGIDFWLMPGALLQGHVLDTRQSPVAGARVMVVDPMALFARRTPKAETTSGADGSFTMVAQPAEQNMLIVRAAGHASYLQPNLQLPQTSLVITLERGVTLTLVAVDAERPEVPAPKVSVIASYRGGFGGGETDANGRLVIENLPTRGSGFGDDPEAILWGGGYIPLTVEIGDPVEGVIDLGTIKVAPGGTIRGRVLDKVTREPIAGARVRSFGGLAMELEMFGAARTVSAPDGSFRLTGVALGAHTLLANHPDYLAEMDMQNLLMGMGGGSGGGTPLFPEGSKDVEKDVELAPAEVATGTVVGPDGKPVAGATVAEVSNEGAIFSQFLGGGAMAPATSDERGAFTLKGLRPGEGSEVVATHRDYGPSEKRRVRGGESVTLELAAPLTIKGVVVDAAGAPVAGARVTATRAGEDAPETPFQSDTTRPTVTAGDGSYLLRNVPAGDLVVTFDHPDHALVTTSVSLVAAHDLGKTVLPAGAAVTGIVVDADGAPVSGISLHAWRHDGESRDGRDNATAMTDEKGRFRMLGLGDGDYQLRMWDQRFYAQEIVVKSGGPEVRIVLKTAGRLVGRVTARGVAVARASVTGRKGDDFVGWARTGADGTFEMGALPPDEPFSVTIAHDEYRELTVESVRASADRTQEFVLQTGVEISGKVVDANGRGVPGTSVNVKVDQSVKSVTTDSSGAFKAGGLGDGRIEVQLAAQEEGFVPTDWIEVAAGARDVRLLAAPGESISGVVRDREGKPMRQVSISAIDATGDDVASTWIWDDGGAFEMKGLPPGTYTLRAQAHAQGREPVTHEVPAVLTGAKNVEIRFP